jgi:hypothetical protein
MGEVCNTIVQLLKLLIGLAKHNAKISVMKARFSEIYI